MSLLKTLKKSADIQGDSDVIGGSFVLETDAYLSTITMAYLLKSASGALGVTVHFKTDKDQEYRQTLYVTSGDAKGNKNTYTKDGKEHYLPGYNQVNSMCLLTIGQELPDVETELKTLKVYNAEAGEEVPTEVEVLTPLINEEIYIGLQKQIVDVRAKGDDGKYHPTGETREVNEIDKVFRASDKMTVAEITAEAEEPEFFERWLTRWEGVTRDRTTKGPSGGAPQTKGALSANGQTAQKPPKTLFAKK